MVPESEQEVLWQEKNRQNRDSRRNGECKLVEWCRNWKRLWICPGDPAITAKIEIHGGMITAYSGQGACIGSGKDSSSEVLIDGGTICLNNKEAWSRDAAHIGKGAANSTRAQTDVTIAEERSI